MLCQSNVKDILKLDNFVKGVKITNRVILTEKCVLWARYNKETDFLMNVSNSLLIYLIVILQVYKSVLNMLFQLLMTALE